MLNCNEIWRELPEFEGYYEVSNLGKVRSIAREVNNTSCSTRLVKSVPMAMVTSTTSPYLYVSLSKHRVTAKYSVHRLVATCFCGKPTTAELLEVNHIDGNALNNIAENLEWITRSENLKWKFIIHPEYREAHGNRMKGTKYNSVSKYHNVSWDKNRNKWAASIKVNRKPLFHKRFELEKDAAEYVNTMLDHYKLTDRPKNIIT